MAKRKIISREYKIMLRANLFPGDETEIDLPAAAFWQNFRHATQDIALDTGGRLDAQKRRLIRFYDTSNLSLRRNDYVFRERVDEASGKREVTLKFRHADRYLSMSRDMTPASDRNARTKLEEDIKAPFKSLYSHSTTQPIRRKKNLNRLNDPFRLFPGLPKQLKTTNDDKAIDVVSQLTARELVLTGAGFRIRNRPKVEAECALVIWYDAKGDRHRPEVVEFSFRYGDNDEAYGPKATRRAYEIFRILQGPALAGWIKPKGMTKTAYAYSRAST